MIGMLVFTLVAIGAYMMILRSYELTAVARYRDAARGVLRTYVDQFERLQTTTPVGKLSYDRYLFYPTTQSGFPLNFDTNVHPSGTWGNTLISDADTLTNPAGDSSPYITIDLGGSDTKIPAKVWREVYYVDLVTGLPVSGNVPDWGNAGYLICGTFKIQYTVRTRQYTDQMSVLRAVP